MDPCSHTCQSLVKTTEVSLVETTKVTKTSRSKRLSLLLKRKYAERISTLCDAVKNLEQKTHALEERAHKNSKAISRYCQKVKEFSCIKSQEETTIIVASLAVPLAAATIFTGPLIPVSSVALSALIPPKLVIAGKFGFSIGNATRTVYGWCSNETRPRSTLKSGLEDGWQATSIAIDIASATINVLGVPFPDHSSFKITANVLNVMCSASKMSDDQTPGAGFNLAADALSCASDVGMMASLPNIAKISEISSLVISGGSLVFPCAKKLTKDSDWLQIKAKL